MRVDEIKNLEPLAKVYELKPECKYIITIPKAMNPAVLGSMRMALNEAGIRFVIFCHWDMQGIKFWGLDDVRTDLG